MSKALDAVPLHTLPGKRATKPRKCTAGLVNTRRRRVNEQTGNARLGKVSRIRHEVERLIEVDARATAGIRAHGQGAPVDVHEPMGLTPMRAMRMVAIAVIGDLQGTVLARHDARTPIDGRAKRQGIRSRKLARLIKRELRRQPGEPGAKIANKPQRRRVVHGNAGARLCQGATLAGKREPREVAYRNRQAGTHPWVETGMVRLTADLVQHGNEALLGHIRKQPTRGLNVNNIEIDTRGASLSHGCGILDALHKRANLTTSAQARSPPSLTHQEAPRSS